MPSFPSAIPATTTLGSHVVTVTFPTGTINNGATATGTLTVQ